MITMLPADLTPAVNSEVRKVTTLRASRILAGLLPAVAVVATTVAAVLAGPADPTGEPATGAATIGMYLSLAAVIVAAGVFGVTGAGDEYRHHTMAVTALFTPARDRLTAAKFIVTAGCALGVAVLVELVALVCLIAFGRNKIQFDADLFASLGGGLLAAVCWSLIGTGLALLLRTKAGALAVLLGWLLIGEPLIWLIASGLGLGGAATVLPGSATIGAVAVGSFPDSDLFAPAPAAAVVLLVWGLGVGAGSWWVLRRRDI